MLWEVDGVESTEVSPRRGERGQNRATILAVKESREPGFWLERKEGGGVYTTRAIGVHQVHHHMANMPYPPKASPQEEALRHAGVPLACTPFEQNEGSKSSIITWSLFVEELPNIGGRD